MEYRHKSFWTGSILLNRPCVALRTRLQVQNHPFLPLHGAHIAVQDQCEISGFRSLESSCDSRGSHSSAMRTAPTIQRLIDQGAQILGDIASSLLHQGHESPSTSNIGQSAAVAAYDWLDFAIGS